MKLRGRCWRDLRLGTGACYRDSGNGVLGQGLGRRGGCFGDYCSGGDSAEGCYWEWRKGGRNCERDYLQLLVRKLRSIFQKAKMWGMSYQLPVRLWLVL